MFERLNVEKKDGIADVRLARPDKLNAMDLQMFSELAECGIELGKDPGLRAVVLSGEGRAFCAGLDIPGLMAGGAGKDGPDLLAASEDSPANFVQRACWVWQEIPLPVIAAVHGVAFGGGTQLAAAADIRFATQGARFSLREIHWGLIPDVSGTQSLRHLLGLDLAKELTFTGREVSGAEAKEIGLVTHLSEQPHEDAMALAKEIAGRNPTAVRAAKQLWNRAVVGDYSEGLALEAALQRTVMGKPNQLEAVRANMEKRPPKFADAE